MKKMVPVVLVLLMAASVSGRAFAAESEKPPVGEILTAIDVADQLKKGSSVEDIAKAVAEQRRYDRESALKKGKTDLQIINYLITETWYSKDVPDKNKSIRSKFEGDANFRKAAFDKAAADYTVAIRNVRDKYDLYKSRGDSYRQYLKAGMSVPPEKGTDGGAGSTGDTGKMLVCSAVASDYGTSLKLNDGVIRKIDANIKALNEKMSKKDLANTADAKVAPHYGRAAGNIQGMRQMDVLYRSRVFARQTDITLKKSLAEIKSLCGEENPALRESPRK